MKQFLITAAGVFAGLMLFLVGIPVLLIGMAASSSGGEVAPDQTVLNLDLRQNLTDQDSGNPLSALSGGSLSVMSIISTLRHAETDDRVKALLIRLPEGGMEPAAADEIRGAIKHFKATGKPVLAHSQGLYPSGMVTSTYAVGTAADELWMQPGASFQVTGIANEDIFFKRMFDKYGVKANYEQRYEYKNAVNGYLHDNYTDAHREAELGWIGSIYQIATAAAAADRKQAPEEMKRNLEAGPYLAEQALKLRLIDKVGQVKDAEEAILAKAGTESALYDFQDYAHSAREIDTGMGPAIAVVEAEGPIVTGNAGSGGNPFSSESTIYSDTMSQALYDAIEDQDVKAIVMRVNSPGGSDTASEQILAAVKTAKAVGKPVVVSMGTYAASGGYWISSQASSIVAQPSSLTGSIGVFGGKFALGEALARYGVDVRQLNVGSSYSGAFGMGREFTPQERASFAGWMDQIYNNFIVRVAQGRKLPEARVREIAKGRVWTGDQARQLGLVDQVGGFYDAVEKAKTLAKLKGEVRLKPMSTQLSTFQALQHALGVSATSVRTLAAAAWVLGDPRAKGMLDQIAEERLRGQTGGAAVLAPRAVH
ncbi:MAG: signal peptide peptidase SppA [Alphaproteobacteria bacterium PA2]|nr:MAG: signal peptide peptidase SppA [Alphaproteobacteria bacterium PA2]